MVDPGFDEMYKGVPPWDIGRPQSEIVALDSKGLIRGRVLDAGCGTGESALYLASRGHEVWGIDAAPRAIAQSKAKAKDRKIHATFVVCDALRLETLGPKFDTVIDSGLFHVFSDEDRPLFAKGLAKILRPGGRYHMLCFSEKEPGDWGPRRVTKEEIRDTFSGEWNVIEIQPAHFDTILIERPIEAWRVLVERA